MRFPDLGKQAERAARRGALGLTGGIFLGVGLTFLTIALWIGLKLAAGAGIAALVIGCLYVAAGCVVIALSRMPKPGPAETGGADTQLSALVTAFLQGLTAGMDSRRKPD